MATATVISQRIGGGSKETVVDIAMDSSYPTGGEVFTAAQVSMSKIHYGIASPKAGVDTSATLASASILPTTAGFNVKTWLADPAEMTNTGSLATVTLRCTLYGT